MKNLWRIIEHLGRLDSHALTFKRITTRFKDKFGEGSHGQVFKGELSNEIVVAVKILNNTDEDRTEFINEVGTMGIIHHVNVVCLLGYCADGFHRALVYDFFFYYFLFFLMVHFQSSLSTRQCDISWMGEAASNCSWYS